MPLYNYPNPLTAPYPLRPNGLGLLRRDTENTEIWFISPNTLANLGRVAFELVVFLLNMEIELFSSLYKYINEYIQNGSASGDRHMS